MKKHRKITKNILFGISVFLMSAFCLFFIIPALLGMKCFFVTNGSMGSVLPVGSLAIVKSVPFDEIEIGDMVAFRDSEQSKAFTHSVVKLDPENKWIYTKGEANIIADPVPSEFKYAEGRVVFHLPVIGFICLIFTSKIGIAVAALILIAFAAFEIVVIRKRGAGKCKKEE